MKIQTKPLLAVLGFLFFSLSLSAQVQNQLSTEDWQADLDFLQQSIHKDYTFLFKKVTAQKWDAEVAKLRSEIPTMADHEIMVGLSRMVAMFGYGHTYLSLSGGKIDYHKIPVNLYQFSDGVFIEGTVKGHEKALGAKVLKIGDTPIEKAIELVYPAVSAENEQFFKAYGINDLTIPEILHAQRIIPNYNLEIPFTLEKDGQVFRYNFTARDKKAIQTSYSFIKNEGEMISARSQSSTPLYLQELDKIYNFNYNPDTKTVYVRQSQVQNDPSQQTLEAFYAEIFDFIAQNEVERFILDVRLNGGGNNYLNKPLITGLIQSKVNEVGKFFCIIGRRTFSACQNLVNELDNYTNVIFVGEPTAENLNFYGDNRKLVLPNSEFNARLSWAWWQDKPQWENQQWMPPNIAVTTTFEQYKNNEDPVLAAAMADIGDDVILDPMGHLTQLFMAGEMEKVSSEAARMVNDPMHQYTDFEALFTQAGYNLLNSDQIQGALFVFDMSSKLFTDSSQLWLGLADALKASGNVDQAKQVYAKVSQMDPYGPQGEKARRALKE
jgi:tetratricopeptide (TPR) repeat protein